MCSIAEIHWQVAINLGDPVFTGQYHGKQVHESDLEDIIQRALDVGCSKLMITGSALEESRQVVGLAKAHRMFFPFFLHLRDGNDAFMFRMLCYCCARLMFWSKSNLLFLLLLLLLLVSLLFTVLTSFISWRLLRHNWRASLHFQILRRISWGPPKDAG